MFENFDIISFLIGLGGGVSVTLFSIKMHKIMYSSNNGNTVDQSGAQAGGDIVGRDKRS